MTSARFEAKMDSLLSFLVGLFHPLQHAGLSRRTPRSRPRAFQPGQAPRQIPSWRDSAL